MRKGDKHARKAKGAEFHPRPSLCQSDHGADEKTRTFTPVKEQRPQRCASTNSATSACGPVLDASYLAAVEWEEKSLFRGKAEPGTGSASS
jgi:hypothetical protein